MVLVDIRLKIEPSMKESGRMICRMVRVRKTGLMAAAIKENTYKA